jgi:hypothetical protein
MAVEEGATRRDVNFNSSQQKTAPEPRLGLQISLRKACHTASSQPNASEPSVERSWLLPICSPRGDTMPHPDCLYASCIPIGLLNGGSSHLRYSFGTDGRWPVESFNVVCSEQSMGREE